MDLSNLVDEIYDVKHIEESQMPAIVPNGHELSIETITMPKNSFRVKRKKKN